MLHIETEGLRESLDVVVDQSSVGNEVKVWEGNRVGVFESKVEVWVSEFIVELVGLGVFSKGTSKQTFPFSESMWQRLSSLQTKIGTKEQAKKKRR